MCIVQLSGEQVHYYMPFLMRHTVCIKQVLIERFQDCSLSVIRHIIFTDHQVYGISKTAHCLCTTQCMYLRASARTVPRLLATFDATHCTHWAGHLSSKKRQDWQPFLYDTLYVCAVHAHLDASHCSRLATLLRAGPPCCTLALTHAIRTTRAFLYYFAQLCHFDARA